MACQDTEISRILVENVRLAYPIRTAVPNYTRESYKIKSYMKGTITVSLCTGKIVYIASIKRYKCREISVRVRVEDQLRRPQNLVCLPSLTRQ